MARLIFSVLLALFGTHAIAGAQQSLTPFCGNTGELSASQQDLVLQFAAVVQKELDASGAKVALIARDGIDLRRFERRYSHAGVIIKNTDGEAASWNVRQLYYDCDLGTPRLYDQGLAGFLLNADKPDLAYTSIVILPPEKADALLQVARDKQRALRLLAAHYSANSYPFSVEYQNCNQWVIELLATAWGDLAYGEDLRQRAQSWLAKAGYDPAPINVDSHLTKFILGFMPLMHLDDHPDASRYGMQFQVSLPDTIEAFVQTMVPQAQRIELCHNQQQIVVRQGWSPLGEGCQPRTDDRVIRYK